MEKELLRSEPIDREDQDAQQPQGYLRIDLTPESRDKLSAWIKNHSEQIEMALGDVHARFEEEINQLEGNMPGGDYPYPGAFRVNVPVTKKKVREIANRLKQAYLDSDPLWAIVSSTLPQETVAQVERALDNQVDNELYILDDIAQALFEAVLHGVGAIEPGWSYHEDTRRDVFKGVGFDGVNLDTLNDLARFEALFPNWREDKKARRLHQKLATGHDVDEEIEYRAATINRPTFTHIPAKDLRIYPHLNSAAEVQFSPCYGYDKTYTAQELEQLAADGIIDEEALAMVLERNESDEQDARDQVEEYVVLKATIRYQLPGDDEPKRYKVWFEKETSTILRIRAFPWWLDEADMVLFHTRQEERGIFKRGIAWDLKDTHIINNVTLNLYLNGADMANSMRWLVKSGSLAEQRLATHRWSPHVPMVYRNDPLEAQSLATSTSHLGPLVQAFELMRRQADEETQTSSLQSGRESPTDPSAPASKTIALLQQVEPNTKENIRSLEPGFRLLGKWLIWLYYQGLRLGWIDEIPGFPEMPDDEVQNLAKQLQPRALLFETDRQNRLQADNMVLGWVTKLAPQAAPAVLRTAISHVSSEWAKAVDSLPLEPQPMPMPGAPGATPTNGQPDAAGQSPGMGSRLSGLVPNGNGGPANPMEAMLAAR